MDFINNMPAYADDCAYIVARRGSDSAWWFWGAYDDRNTANQAAIEIEGAVFARKDFE